MQIEHALEIIKSSQDFFERATRALEEKDSTFMPMPGMMTVAQQVFHVAHTIDWFLDGAFSETGFDLDFAASAALTAKVTSLTEARECYRSSVKQLVEALEKKPAAEWSKHIVPGLIMGGESRFEIIGGIVDHTAHHRGSLAVYTRLLGKTPPMPYIDM